MQAHRYAISVDRPAATVTLTISDQDSDATIDRRHVATPSPLLGVARIILADYLRAADPHSHAVPTYSVSQVHTLKRLLDRRLREDSRAVLTSSDIGAALLKAFVAPPAGTMDAALFRTALARCRDLDRRERREGRVGLLLSPVALQARTVQTHPGGHRLAAPLPVPSRREVTP